MQQHPGLGQSLQQIARAVGLDRWTVRKYLPIDQPPVYPARRPRPTRLTPYRRYLAERWAHGYDLKAHFQTLLAQCDPAALDQWLQDGETSDRPSFQSVARIFYQDDNAIKAAVTTPLSKGQSEGQICRGKLLRRLSYGRAKLDVLRQRILHRVAVPVRPVKPSRQVNHHVAA